MTEERGEYIRFLNGEVLVFKHFLKSISPNFLPLLLVLLMIRMYGKILCRKLSLLFGPDI